MDGLREKTPLSSTLYYKGDGAITEPLVVKPAHWSRRQWRAAVKRGKRMAKQNAKAEARRPESEKIDERLHAAGLVSPRDARQLVGVRLDRVLEGVH
jgi:hypothetical protein